MNLYKLQDALQSAKELEIYTTEDSKKNTTKARAAEVIRKQRGRRDAFEYAAQKFIEKHITITDETALKKFLIQNKPSTQNQAEYHKNDYLQKVCKLALIHLEFKSDLSKANISIDNNQPLIENLDSIERSLNSIITNFTQIRNLLNASDVDTFQSKYQSIIQQYALQVIQSVKANKGCSTLNLIDEIFELAYNILKTAEKEGQGSLDSARNNVNDKIKKCLEFAVINPTPWAELCKIRDEIAKNMQIDLNKLDLSIFLINLYNKRLKELDKETNIIEELNHESKELIKTINSIFKNLKEDDQKDVKKSITKQIMEKLTIDDEQACFPTDRLKNLIQLIDKVKQLDDRVKQKAMQYLIESSPDFINCPCNDSSIDEGLDLYRDFANGIKNLHILIKDKLLQEVFDEKKDMATRHKEMGNFVKSKIFPKKIPNLKIMVPFNEGTTKTEVEEEEKKEMKAQKFQPRIIKVRSNMLHEEIDGYVKSLKADSLRKLISIVGRVQNIHNIDIHNLYNNMEVEIDLTTGECFLSEKYLNSFFNSLLGQFQGNDTITISETIIISNPSLVIELNYFNEKFAPKNKKSLGSQSAASGAQSTTSPNTQNPGSNTSTLPSLNPIVALYTMIMNFITRLRSWCTCCFSKDDGSSEQGTENTVSTGLRHRA